MRHFFLLWGDRHFSLKHSPLSLTGYGSHKNRDPTSFRTQPRHCRRHAQSGAEKVGNDFSSLFFENFIIFANIFVCGKNVVFFAYHNCGV